MAESTNSKDQVKIMPPDRTLQKKLGGASFDQIVPPQAVAAAQEAIVQASGQMMEESFDEVRKLETAIGGLASASADKARIVRELIAASFSVKAKAGLGGYELVAMLAKSLHLRCEQLGDASLAAAHLPIVRWHIASMRRLLDLKVKGLGGPTGEAILAELNKLDSASSAES